MRRFPTGLSIFATTLCLLAGCRLWHQGGQVATRAVSFKPSATLAPLTSLLSEDAWHADSGWSANVGRTVVSTESRHRFRWEFGPEPIQSVLQALESPADSTIAESDATELQERPAIETTETNNDQPNEAPKSEPAVPPESASPPEQSEADGSDLSGVAQTTAQKDPEAGEEAKLPSLSPTDTEPSDDPQERWDGFWPLSIGQVLRELESDSAMAVEKGTRVAQTEPGTVEHSLSMLSKLDDLVGWNAAILRARRFPRRSRDVIPLLERLVSNPPRYRSDQLDQKFASPADPKAARETPKQKSTGWFERFAGIVGNSKKQASVESAPPSDNSDPSNAKDRQNAHGPPVRISTAMQSAAAEAWCLVLAASQPDPVDGLAPVGRFLQRSDVSISVRAELFRSAARWVAPADIPRLGNALRTADSDQRAPPEARRAAIEACLIHAIEKRPTPANASQNGESAFDRSLWPTTVDNCRFDPDTHVRSHYGLWLAVAGHPRAFDTLKRQTSDVSVRVRESALISMGHLGTDEALEELRLHARHPKSRVRSIAIEGLSNWGPTEIAPFADDESLHVRQAVAAALIEHPDADSAFILKKLLGDKILAVQQVAVESTSGWPNQLARPLLLSAMQDALLPVRRTAAEKLWARGVIEVPYPFDGSRREREQAVAMIAQQNGISLSYLGLLHIGNLPAAPVRNELHVADIYTALDELKRSPLYSPAHVKALTQLQDAAPGDLEIIEQYLSEKANDEPDAAGLAAVAYRELLPAISPTYDSLERLASSDINTRRQAAQQLSQLGAEASLSQLAVRRLRERLKDEQDGLVWRYAMSAIDRDATSESAEIALLAINHVWPDIRKLGCDYVARHGRPEYGGWLLPLFDDDDENVRLAAVNAAGYCGNPMVVDGRGIAAAEGSTPGLRGLLTDSDRRIRFAAAISMSRLGDEQGMHELVRLSYNLNASIRENVAREMARTGRTRFLERLILMAQTESHDRVKRSILESLDQLVTAEKRPAGLFEVSNVDAKIKLWEKWWRQRQQPAS